MLCLPCEFCAGTARSENNLFIVTFPEFIIFYRCHTEVGVLSTGTVRSENNQSFVNFPEFIFFLVPHSVGCILYRNCEALE